MSEFRPIKPLEYRQWAAPSRDMPLWTEMVDWQRIWFIVSHNDNFISWERKYFSTLKCPKISRNFWHWEGSREDLQGLLSVISCNKPCTCVITTSVNNIFPWACIYNIRFSSVWHRNIFFMYIKEDNLPKKKLTKAYFILKPLKIPPLVKNEISIPSAQWCKQPLGET